MTDAGWATDADDEAPLSRGGGVALWRQIAQTLRQQISAGEHAPGERLPTEAELAKRFSVNRHTVRRAVATLVADGLLRVDQGRGTFVQDHVLDYIVSRQTRMSENVLRAQRAWQGRLLHAGESPASAMVAAALKIEEGAPVIRIERVAVADERPISLGTHCLPMGRFPDFIARFEDTLSISRTLESYGLNTWRRQVSRITARLPSPETAKILEQPATRPILVTDSVNVDQDDQPIEHSLSRFASDRVQLVVEP